MSQQQNQEKKEKTKVRFTSLDISALVGELKQKLIGLRVANIYDLSNKMYCIKMGGSENKQEFIIENGVRFHTTTEDIKKKKVPSAFTMKFRKYLRSKRLEDIRQVGVERVVVMTFGSGELQNHLIIELYSQGNVILTDKDYGIIQLIRSHQFTETVKTAIGEKYPFDHAANLYLENFDVSEENIRKLISTELTPEQKEQKEREEEKLKQEQLEKEEQEAQKNKKKQQNDDEEEEGDENQKKKKKKPQPQSEKTQTKKTKKAPTQKKPKSEKEKKLKDVVFKIVPSLHQPIIDHVIATLNIDPNQKCSEEQIPEIKKVSEACIELQKKYLQSKSSITKGYLVISDKSKQHINDNNIQQEGEQIKKEDLEKKKKNEIFFEFSPLILDSYQGKEVKELLSFNEAIDLYFQKLSKMQQGDQESFLQGGNGVNQKQSIILKKFNNIIRDQDARIQVLQTEQQESERKAYLIEKNVQEVDAIGNIVKQMKQGGLPWDKIQKMINEGKENGDPLANLIQSMDFDKNRITILLCDPDEDDQEEMTEVEIDIDDNAYTNARSYYQNKKFNIKKEIKTQEAKDIALKQAEITAGKEMEKHQIKQNAVANRKPAWFEKFHWFISTENYLVISGRDAAQNEVIIKKYTRKGDIYMHADYHGAASMVIKNNNPSEPIPQVTLDEAAQASISRSKAWDSKILASCYWVYDHQVSKKAETGEYLPHGSFMIRGKKNFITPMRLEMGVALLYKIDEESLKARHMEDRTIKNADDDQSKSNINDMELIKEESEISESGIKGEGEELPSYEALKKLSSVYSQQQDEEWKQKSTIIDTNLQKQKQQPPKHQKPNKQQVQQELAKKQKEEAQRQNEAAKRGSKSKNGGLQEDEDENQNKKQQQTNNINVPRGKANKIRKMKQKYGDQTEDERQFKMKMLGAKQVDGFDWQIENDRKQLDQFEQKQKQEELQKLKKLQKEEEEEKLEQQQKQQQEEQIKMQELKEKEQEKEKLIQAQEAQEKKEIENELDEEEIKEIEEEKRQAEQQKLIKYEEEEQQINQELKELSKLVTYTTTEDNYSNLIFMCAPYSTLQSQNCKFRVKLVPGTQKKGKASREIQQYFLSLKETTPTEKKVIKCISDQEMIDQIIGNCKIGASGLLKMKHQQKSQKKQQKKAQDKAEQEIKEKSLLY